MMPLDELQRVLTPPKRPYRANGDWAAVEAALELRLPADYKAFIGVYGQGTINGGLELQSPFGPPDDIRKWWANWAAFYDDIAEYEEVPYPVYPAAGGLLPFGTLGDVNILNWRTEGDPDLWPFVYYDRHEGFIEVKVLSAVEFVLEAVTQRSPLMIRLGSESVFNPPHDFEAHNPNPRRHDLVHPAGANIDALATKLLGRWPAQDVRVRPRRAEARLRGEEGVRLLVEALWGWVTIAREGDPRTFFTVRYDQSCAREAEEVLEVARSFGFCGPDIAQAEPLAPSPGP